jgi:hypothetical protein
MKTGGLILPKARFGLLSVFWVAAGSAQAQAPFKSHVAQNNNSSEKLWEEVSPQRQKLVFSRASVFVKSLVNDLGCEGYEDKVHATGGDLSSVANLATVDNRQLEKLIREEFSRKVLAEGELSQAEEKLLHELAEIGEIYNSKLPSDLGLSTLATDAQRRSETQRFSRGEVKSFSAKSLSAALNKRLAKAGELASAFNLDCGQKSSIRRRESSAERTGGARTVTTNPNTTDSNHGGDVPLLAGSEKRKGVLERIGDSTEKVVSQTIGALTGANKNRTQAPSAKEPPDPAPAPKSSPQKTPVSSDEKTAKPKKPKPLDDPPPVPTPPIPLTPELEGVIAASRCTTIHKNGSDQRFEYLGYRDGVFRTFVRSYCRDDAFRDRMSAAAPDYAWTQAESRDTWRLEHKLRDYLSLPDYRASHDAIASTMKEGSAEDVQMVTLYATLLSSGYYESSGKIGEGVDVKAPAGRGSSEKEAGLFQASQNVLNFKSAMLNEIIVDYKRSWDQAMERFKGSPDAVRLASESVCGTGVYARERSGDLGYAYRNIVDSFAAVKVNQSPVISAASFQSLMKSCPHLTTEFGALIQRGAAAHLGPLRRGELVPGRGENIDPNPNPACVQTFRELARELSKPGACEAVEALEKGGPAPASTTAGPAAPVEPAPTLSQTEGTPGAESPAADQAHMPGPPPTARNVNNSVVDAISSMPLGGGYMTGETYQALKSSIDGKNGVLTVNPKENASSMCSSATYQIFLKSVLDASKASGTPLTAETVKALQVEGQVEGTGIWGYWNANGPGIACLFQDLGLGPNFTDLSQAKSGDFLKIWWKSGTDVGSKEKGHSVVFMGTETKKNPKTGNPETYVKFWSSSKKNSDGSSGYGYNSVPLSDVGNMLFSRLEHPENINKKLSVPKNSYLNGMKTGGDVSLPFDDVVTADGSGNASVKCAR